MARIIHSLTSFSLTPILPRRAGKCFTRSHPFFTSTLRGSPNRAAQRRGRKPSHPGLAPARPASLNQKHELYPTAYAAYPVRSTAPPHHREPTLDNTVAPTTAGCAARAADGLMSLLFVRISYSCSVPLATCFSPTTIAAATEPILLY